MHASQRDNFSSLKRRRAGDPQAQPQTAPKAESKWRTKLAADEMPPLHPLALYRPGRLCSLFDIDRSTLMHWRKQGVLPPFTTVGGIEGLTGQQLMDFWAERQREQRSAAAGDEIT